MSNTNANGVKCIISMYPNQQKNKLILNNKNKIKNFHIILCEVLELYTNKK